MIKLIETSSPLKRLPKEIGRKDILIFDSLRFTCEIIEHAHHQLMANILELSYGTSNKHLPSVFGYAWSIIDQTVRLSNICKRLPWEKENEIVGHLSYLKDFRNTYQHLDERIQKALLENELPFYGVISWVYKTKNTLKFELCQLVSGNWISGRAAQQTVPEINLESPEIIDLLLHTVNRKGEIINVNLENVIEDVKSLVVEIENRFRDFCEKNEFQFIDWSARQDVFFRIKNE
ncbi:hypothetical protein ACLI09_01100 [Flavobacterium sp. RHBU_24]|uniref:hypothetical protein n=1 Tax=Flavobacterium sp. RHBU_24 TaxID=3391185 RepID=UPI003984FA49